MTFALNRPMELTLFQINTTVNTGSTGRIAEEIGELAIDAGCKSYIAAAYTDRPSKSEVVTIGSSLDRKMHGLKTRILDRHGFGSADSTLNLIKKIKKIQPDVIHLHNIHGYFLHIGKLFEFLKSEEIPIVWTLHDCWSFTGHCAHFERVNCNKWKDKCHSCPLTKGYPASWGIDNSTLNFIDKSRIFNGIKNLHIVTPSQWLAEQVSCSFLQNYPIKVIHNGIDLNVFYPRHSNELRKKYNLQDSNILLGVASTWKKPNVLNDFIRLSSMIGNDQKIVLVGLSPTEISSLPSNIIGIKRTENLDELAALYSEAAVFLNPTYVDTFPNTNLEALACGTPIITYRTGGSPEAISEDTGVVVEKGDLFSLYEASQNIISKGKAHYTPLCRHRAERYFNKDVNFVGYMSLYQEICNVALV